MSCGFPYDICRHPRSGELLAGIWKEDKVARSASRSPGRKGASSLGHSEKTQGLWQRRRDRDMSLCIVRTSCDTENLELDLKVSCVQCWLSFLSGREAG